MKKILLFISIITFLIPISIITNSELQSYRKENNTKVVSESMNKTLNSNEKSSQDKIFELRKKLNNENVIGRIENKALNIDEIIVKSKDDTYWLNHDINNKKNKYGTIFLDHYNRSDFSDWNNNLFGHKMLDDKMFSNLTKLQNQKYTTNLQSSNKDIFTITSIQGVEHYKIISIKRIKKLDRNFYKTQEDRDWLINLINTSDIVVNKPKEAIEKYVILSTCVNPSADDHLRQIVLLQKISE